MEGPSAGSPVCSSRRAERPSPFAARGGYEPSSRGRVRQASAFCSARRGPPVRLGSPQGPDRRSPNSGRAYRRREKRASGGQPPRRDRRLLLLGPPRHLDASASAPARGVSTSQDSRAAPHERGVDRRAGEARSVVSDGARGRARGRAARSAAGLARRRATPRPGAGRTAQVLRQTSYEPSSLPKGSFSGRL